MLQSPVIVLELYYSQFTGMVRLIHQTLMNNEFDGSAVSYVILEYFSQKALRQQIRWTTRSTNKKYKVRFAASLALALHEWMQTCYLNTYQQEFLWELNGALTDANLVP